MQERVDHTEPVQLLAAEGSPPGAALGTPVAQAVCRYTLVDGAWRGMLSDIRPSHVIEPGPYEAVFPDGRRGRIVVTALSPNDLRRAYYTGAGPWPGEPGGA